MSVLHRTKVYYGLRITTAKAQNAQRNLAPGGPGGLKTPLIVET